MFKTKLEEEGWKWVYMWIYVLHNCKFCLLHAIVFLVLTKFLERRPKKVGTFYEDSQKI